MPEALAHMRELPKQLQDLLGLSVVSFVKSSRPISRRLESGPPDVPNRSSSVSANFISVLRIG